MSFTSIALMGGADPRWKEVALIELEAALNDDPTSAALLAPAITFELDTGKDALAKAHYEMFKRVAKGSPLNALVHAQQLDHEQTK
jgi:hypothetical protein